MTSTPDLDNGPEMAAPNSQDSKPVDPFLDVDIGPALWTKLAPTGQRYWPFIVLLALGLSGFSYYWRNHWVPSQPLIWQTSDESQLRKAMDSGNPVLIWYDPVQNSVPITAQARSGEQSDVAGLTTKREPTSVALTEAIAGLDVPDIRRSLRLHSAELWKVESPFESAVSKRLLMEAKQNSPILILWHARHTPPHRLSPAEIQRDSIMNWLETIR